MSPLNQLIGASIIGFLFYFWLFFLAPKMIPRKDEGLSEDLKDFIDDIEYHSDGRVKPHQLK